MNPLVTIVIPVYNEKDNIKSALEKIKDEVHIPYIIHIVYDFDEDNTIPIVKEVQKEMNIPVRLVKNIFGRGALNAIKTGLLSAESEYVVVTMADLSDSPKVINDMVECAQKVSAHVVCGSRYMPGGKQIGGPFLKTLMSKWAGKSLYYLTSLPTQDATNSFKLYSKKVLDSITIESTGGFELGLEIVIKSHFMGYKVSEVPTTWFDRTEGQSRFKLISWLPHYLKWYIYAIRKSWFKI